MILEIIIEPRRGAAPTFFPSSQEGKKGGENRSNIAPIA